MDELQYNLWDGADWVQVETSQGPVIALSLRETLTHAHTLRAVYAQSPIETAGIFRLLVAIAQDIFRPETRSDLVTLLEAGRFPADALDAFGAEFGHRFDLFDPEWPWMQCVGEDISSDLASQESMKTVSSVARLTADLPVGTYSTYRSGRLDTQHLFCPACAARSMTAHAPFMTMGGGGLRRSINENPPIYVFPEGRTLFEALIYSLVTPDFQPSTRLPDDSDPVWWRRAHQVIARDTLYANVSYLHSLTFVPRRIRLYPENVPGLCTRCGERTPLGIRYIHFSQGESRQKDVGVWEDPFVAFRKNHKTGALFAACPKGELYPWRDLLALAVNGPAVTRPAVIQQMLSFGFAPVSLRFIALETSQAKFIAWLDENLPVSGSLLADPQQGAAMTAMLDFAFDGIRAAKSKLGGLLPGEPREPFGKACWGLLHPGFQRLQAARFSPAAQVAWLDFVIATVRDLFWRSIRLAADLRSVTEQEGRLAGILFKSRKTVIAERGLPVVEEVQPSDEAGGMAMAFERVGRDAGLRKRIAAFLGKPPAAAGELAGQLLDGSESLYLEWAVLTFTCAAQVKHAEGLGVGQALRWAGVKQDAFERLLACPAVAELAQWLASAFSARRGVSLDFDALVQDFRHWGSPQSFVQRRWAKEYFGY